MAEFTGDEMFAPANIRQPAGRPEETAKVDSDLAAVDRHVSAGDARKGDEAFRPLHGTFPVPEALA